ncbi:RAQPRD family integrative conjugative element protein [Streptomyces sp. ME01-24h]|nr:RAQPRD family integrative conjugative element protein [Streptomyces sp. ME19-03-3]MDX3214868.1 RAQPRD family integrative conjugative element protein [Streptomyces sp. ME02-6991-2B]MDX3353815.1 RAQPRD family integrative conjugative element protein [Streptomyces sp. ME01-24h]
MSLQDELASVQRRLDELGRAVARLERHVGDSLDMRRVRADTEHLGDDLALLRDSVGTTPVGRQPRQEMVTIPDTPYDPSLWSGAEDEGLGAPDRRAP